MVRSRPTSTCAVTFNDYLRQGIALSDFITVYLFLGTRHSSEDITLQQIPGTGYSSLPLSQTMSQSLSALFGGSQSNKGDSTSGLFSASAVQKFARVYKPEEFDLPVKKVPEPADEDAEDAEPLEKRKKPRKERKPKTLVPAEGDSAGSSVAAEPAQSDHVPKAGDQDNTTVFVGNIPTSETTKSITKFFKTYGEIESVRLRSVPVAGAKVDEVGNQDLVKKVCVNSKKFGEQKGSFNAYVKFKEASGATAALAANNQLMGKRHMRVDRVTPTLFDPKRSVFLGGLPHYADEEEIREFFAQVQIVCALRGGAPRSLKFAYIITFWLLCVGPTKRPRRHRGPAYHPRRKHSGGQGHWIPAVQGQRQRVEGIDSAQGSF
jgi:RNA recognition motif-containing protein